MVKYGDAIDVKGIISLVTERLSTGERYYNNLYAMRLHHLNTREVCDSFVFMMKDFYYFI